MSYKLNPKSTPLSKNICPKRALSVEEHSVTQREDGKYECVCGCVFEWEDQFHWSIVLEEEPSTPPAES